jgi:hypothetical protein
MSKKAAVKLTRVNRDTLEPTADVERYCRGLNDWPRSWMGSEQNVPSDRQLVACFRPFLQYLVMGASGSGARRRPGLGTGSAGSRASADLSPKTVQKHVDNLWVLGGEIIRDLNDPSLRKKPIEQILFHVFDDDGGPLIYGVTSEEQQRSFDSTCRKVLTDFLRPLRRRTRQSPTNSPEEAIFKKQWLSNFILMSFT